MQRIALIYDAPGWAFHRIGIQVAKHCAKDLEIVLIPSGSPRSWKRFHTSIAGDFDWYHYLWRGAIESLVKNGPTNISTSVYDHLFLDNLKFTSSLLRHAPFYVSNMKLQNEYARIFPNRNIAEHADGVDTKFFSPMKPINLVGKLRVGWVGNSKWGSGSHKGFHDIFLKSIEKARSLGMPIEAHVADKSSSRRTHLEMAEFYQEIDVLCCTSKAEGTPNPILESSASGRGWISTDVGIVSELAGDVQKSFIVKRDVDSFVTSYERLLDNRKLVDELGVENRTAVVDAWTWERKGFEIGEFLREAIAQR